MTEVFEPTSPPPPPELEPSFTSAFPEKPPQVTAIAVLTIISGLSNIIAGVGWSIAAAASIVGFCCLPVTVLPVILGIFELIYAPKLIADPPTGPIDQTIAILEIIGVLSGNVFSLAAGLLALVFANDAAVKAYFARVLPGSVPPQTYTPAS